jgi:hypothetical protein
MLNFILQKIKLVSSYLMESRCFKNLVKYWENENQGYNIH